MHYDIFNELQQVMLLLACLNPKPLYLIILTHTCATTLLTRCKILPTALAPKNGYLSAEMLKFM